MMKETTMLSKTLQDHGWFRAIVASALVILFMWLVATPVQAQTKGGTVLPSGIYTATTNSGDIINSFGKGLVVFVRISTYTSGNWTPAIQGKDPVSGQYTTILTGTALSSTGLTVLKIYPGITASANVAVSDVIPVAWRVVMTGASTPNSAFSVGYVILP